MRMTAAVILIAVVLVCAGYSILPTYFNKLVHPGVPKTLRQGGKTVALTFDDGPDPRYTGELLDLLQQEQIPATFFMVAKKADASPALVDRMIQEGHAVALHSLEHANALLKGFRYTKEDFAQCREIISRRQWPVTLYRPPWGHTNLFSLHFARKNGFRPILWSVMAQDWSSQSTPEIIAQKLLKRVCPGSIICLHDSGGAEGAPRNTIAALRNALPALKEKGFEFIILDNNRSKYTHPTF